MIDAHCHEERPDAYVAARALGVDGWFWSAVTPDSNPPPGVWVALGLHPWNALELSHAECVQGLEHLDVRCMNERPNAVGEIGLDHCRARTPAEREHGAWVFRTQLELALRHNLPVVVHSVRCHREVVAELERVALPRKGMIHAFEDPRWLGAYRRLGYLVSLSPHSLRFFSHFPSDGFVMETDAPGRKSRLADLPALVAQVAERLRVSADVLVGRCDALLRAAFSLPGGPETILPA